MVKYNKIIFWNVSNTLNKNTKKINSIKRLKRLSSNLIKNLISKPNKNCSGGCPVSSKYFTGTFEGKDEFCYIGV